MKASEIHFIADRTAAICAGVPDADPLPDALHDYCLQRGFPPAETLARKLAELDGARFAWPDDPDARRFAEMRFSVYRALAQVLQPYHDEDRPAGIQIEALQAPDGTQTEVGRPALDLSLATALLGDFEGPGDLLRHIAETPTEQLANDILGCSTIEAAELQLFALQILAPFCDGGGRWQA